MSRPSKFEAISSSFLIKLLQFIRLMTRDKRLLTIFCEHIPDIIDRFSQILEKIASQMQKHKQDPLPFEIIIEILSILKRLQGSQELVSLITSKKLLDYLLEIVEEFNHTLFKLFLEFLVFFLENHK